MFRSRRRSYKEYERARAALLAQLELLRIALDDYERQLKAHER